MNQLRTLCQVASGEAWARIENQDDGVLIDTDRTRLWDRAGLLRLAAILKGIAETIN